VSLNQPTCQRALGYIFFESWAQPKENVKEKVPGQSGNEKAALFLERLPYLFYRQKEKEK
jgi:hypothetical protein